MAISKIILNGVTQMDVTQDTVASNNLLSGETATGADGEQVVGAIPDGDEIGYGSSQASSLVGTATVGTAQVS